MAVLKTSLSLMVALLVIQRATTYRVPLSSVLLFLPFGFLLALLASVPISILFGLLADSRLRASLPTSSSSAARLRSALRPLAHTTPSAWSAAKLKATWSSPPAPLHPSLPPSLATSLDSLLSKIIDEFVLSWYLRISPDKTFPNRLDQTIRSALGQIISRLESADLPSLVVSTIIPHITSHLLSTNNAERSLKGPSSSTSSASPADTAADLFLAQAYNPASLHPAVSSSSLETRPAQEAHMRGLVEGILELVLEESERKSRAVMIIAREIVACAVLMPVVEMMSDPDFWNKILDEQAGNYIRQQKLVSQLRSALDQTITGPPSSSSPHRREASLPLQPLDPNSRSIPSTTTPLPFCPAKPSISSKTSSKSFESFVRGIGRMDSLMDLRRLRNDLGGEIRKTKGILESLHQQQQASSASSTPAIPNERRPEVLRAHLERLYEARAKAESRIAQLSTDNSSSSSTLTSPLKSTRKFSSAIRTDTKLSSVTPSPSHKLSLREVLVNPGTLGYFLEFMERRGGMLLVQFWLIVEGFKDPLEGDVAAEWKGNEAQSAAEAVEKGEGEEAVQTAREDMRAVWEGYFEADLLGDEVVDRYGADVRSFVEGRGEKGLAQARKSLFLAQRFVYSQLLEDHFPPFKNSDLYFKALSSTSPLSSMPPTTRLPASTFAPQPPAFPHRQTAPISTSYILSPTPSTLVSPTTSVHVRPSLPPPPQPSSPTPSTSSSLFSNRMRDPKSVRSLLQQTSATISVPQVSIETPNFDKKIVRAESQANAMLSSSSSASSLLPPASSTPAFQRALTSPSASIAASPSSSTIPPSRSSRPELDFLIGLTTEDAASGLFEAEASSRAPLFDESEAATDALLVRHPESDEDGEEDYIQIQRMDAIQAALTSIIAKDEASSGGSSSAATPAPNASVSVKRSKSTSDRARRMGSESSMARSLEALPLSSNQIDPPSFPSQTSTPPAPSPSAKSLSSSVPELPEPTQTTKPLRKRVFEEDDDPDTSHLSTQNTPLLYQYADSDDEDVHPHDPNSSRSRLFFASPGDLQLPAEIARLGEKISTLQGQEPILDALIRKAELTGADAELELLNKSHSGLQQEIRALIFQKHQFEQQELDNRLEPGRTRITIPGTMEGNDPSSSAAESGGGKAVVRYLVQVEQLGQDGGVRYGWVVRRRYNDFWELQKGLKESVRETRGLGLPGKMGGLGVGGLAMSASWVDGRRLALERYMQSLVAIPQACDSLQLRAFLSQTPAHLPAPTSPSAPQKSLSAAPFLPQNIVKQIYRTVATGIDDTLLSTSPSFASATSFSGAGGLGGLGIGGNPASSMLDLIGQRLTRQAGEFASLAGLGLGDAASGALRGDSAGFGAVAKAASGAGSTTATAAGGSASHPPELLDLPPELKPLGGETASSYFTAPICDLFIEIFELKENNWLRRQAIVIILQQLLGGTIERKLRDVFRSLTSPPSILKYLVSFSNGMWPNGGPRRPASVPRTPEQKLQTKMDASKKVSSLMPDVASNMIGRSNARRGARRLFSVVQNQRLNQHLIHTIIDEVVFAIFPELKERDLSASTGRKP